MSLHSLAHLERDGAGLGVGHEAAGAEDPAQLADHAHHVGSGDGGVEVEHAALDQSGQVFGAHDVGAGCFGLGGLLALGEHGHPHGLAGAVRQHARAAHLLVGVPGIDARV